VNSLHKADNRIDGQKKKNHGATEIMKRFKDKENGELLQED